MRWRLRSGRKRTRASRRELSIGEKIRRMALVNDNTRSVSSLRDAQFRIPAKHSQRFFQTIGFRGVVRVEHPARLFLVDAQPPRKFDSGYAFLSHLEIQRRF